MLDNFIYENHQGRRFSGLENGVYLNYNTLRDYTWAYATINDKISRFYRPIATRSLPLVVQGKTDADAIRVKNRLLDLTDTDVIARKPGKIYVGDYYTTGYIITSKKTNYLIAKQHCQIALELVSDDPAWYKEQKHVFLAGTGDDMGTGGTDYPYDYPYDYAITLNGQKIICDTIDANPFRLVIYGRIADPSISIGAHTYTINGVVGEGESLMVDSLAKTITLTKANGQKVNWFDKRGRGDYIFQPIPAGQNIISWAGTFGFDLTVIEKRSEPKWI